MPRGQTTFKIEGYEQPFTVKELTPRQIIAIFQMEGLTDHSIVGLKDHFFKSVLPLAMPGVSADSLLDMLPSDLALIWAKFQEVNKAFFELASRAGVGKIVEQIKAAALSDYFSLLAASSRLATSGASTTATPSSSQP